MATQRSLAELLNSGPAHGDTATPQADPPAREHDAIPVHTAVNGQADRITLYLHPIDHRALGLAKVDDRIDNNTRIRAMIALWRDDPAHRDRVDRLARAAAPHSRPGAAQAR